MQLMYYQAFACNLFVIQNEIFVVLTQRIMLFWCKHSVKLKPVLCLGAIE